LGRALQGAPDHIADLEVQRVIASSAPSSPSTSPFDVGPALAKALTPLSTGVIIGIMALVAYDGLLIRIEKVAGELDRLGAETVDAIALTAPVLPPMITLGPASSGLPRSKVFSGHGPANAQEQVVPHWHVRPDESVDSARRSVEHETGF
jgi:hypothetical protein